MPLQPLKVDALLRKCSENCHKSEQGFSEIEKVYGKEKPMGKRVLFAEDDSGEISMVDITEEKANAAFVRDVVEKGKEHVLIPNLDEIESFVVEEVDPNGVSQHNHGSKLDSGKPDLSLLLMFGRALAEVGRVGTFGAVKYTRGGWRGVTDGINRYTAAMLRHLFKEDRSSIDDELPVLHAAQVAWNALARLELICKDMEDSEEAERRGG